MGILVPAHENNVKVHTDIGESQILILIMLHKNSVYSSFIHRNKRFDGEKEGQEV